MCIFTFFQYREERFRQTSESTNSRVLWWSLGQTCILIVMGAWQMRHLKTFFEAKKLVWKYKKCLSIMWDTTLLYLQQSKSNFQILKNHRFRCDFFRVFFLLFPSNGQTIVNEWRLCFWEPCEKKIQFLVLILIII